MRFDVEGGEKVERVEGVERVAGVERVERVEKVERVERVAEEGYYVPAEYVTEPIDLGSKLFDKFFRAHGPFDIVANFAARKHVRAERDIH